MATEESTTQQTPSAQQVSPSISPSVQRRKSRRLTVSPDPVSGNEKFSPYIRLLGRWLEHAGFTIGSKVEVSVELGHLRIDIASPPVERKPRLPRKAQ